MGILRYVVDMIRNAFGRMRKNLQLGDEGQLHPTDMYERLRVPTVILENEDNVAFGKMSLNASTFDKLDQDIYMEGQLNGKAFTVTGTNIYGRGQNIDIELEDGTRYNVSLSTRKQVVSFSEYLKHPNGITEKFENERLVDFNADVLIKTSRKVYRINNSKSMEYMEDVAGEELQGYWKKVLSRAEPRRMSSSQYKEITGLSRSDLPPSQPEGLQRGFRVLKCAGIQSGFRRKIKSIEYLYSSREAFLNEGNPYMIIMDGIDGRDYHSRVFRQKGDVYVDNSTIRRKKGKYSYDTVTYQEIMQLAGSLSPQLPQKMQEALEEKIEEPKIIREVVKKVLDLEIRAERLV